MPLPGRIAQPCVHSVAMTSRGVILSTVTGIISNKSVIAVQNWDMRVAPQKGLVGESQESRARIQTRQT